MRNYDEIIGKMMRSAVALERYTVLQGEPPYVIAKVREILSGIAKFDEYMAYGADSELFNELVEVENK